MGLWSAIGTVAGAYFGGPAGASIGGAIGGAIDGNQAKKDGEEGVEQQNALNSAEAAKSRAWQEEMRNTAYQSTTADMRKAGLNPMMAFSQGATATPGAPATARMENIKQGASQTALNSVQAQNVIADTNNKRAQAEQIETQTALMKAQEKNTSAQTDKTRAETGNIEATLPKINQEIKNLKLQARTEEERVILTREQQILTTIQQDLAKGQITKQEAETKTQNVITTLKRLEVPGAKNLADFENMLSTGGGNAANIGGAAGTLMNSARKVFGK